MNNFSIALASLGTSIALMLAGCSPGQKRLDQLDIQVIETGPVPASTVSGLPDEESQVRFTHENAGMSVAVYRRTIACPTRMINSVSGIKVEQDRILLCFEPIEAASPQAVPLSSCPYHLAIKYEMAGIPRSVQPDFEVVNDCAGFD